MESILLIQSGFLGDAVLASGMVRTLRTAKPDASIGIVVRAEFGELYQKHPAIDTVHRFDKKKTGGTKALIEELRRADYHTALLPHRSFRTAYIALRAGIKRRIGFTQSDAPWLLTDRVQYNIARHELTRNAALVGQLGIDVHTSDIASWLVPDEQLVEQFRTQYSSCRVILIAPGSVWATKQWGADAYASVAMQLKAKRAHVLLTGSLSERELCSRIAMSAGLDAKSVVAGEINLSELIALVSIAERVITNDSAALHIAESVGVPVTAIFGPTVPEFGFGPRLDLSNVAQTSGLSCRPCGIHGDAICPLGTHDCMKLVTPDSVIELTPWS